MSGPKLGALILGVPGMICIVSQVFRMNPSWPIFGLGFVAIIFAMMIVVDR